MHIFLQVFKNCDNDDKIAVFENKGARTTEKQEQHTLEATKVMESELKSTLAALAQELFGQGVILIEGYIFLFQF